MLWKIISCTSAQLLFMLFVRYHSFQTNSFLIILRLHSGQLFVKPCDHFPKVLKHKINIKFFASLFKDGVDVGKLGMINCWKHVVECVIFQSCGNDKEICALHISIRIKLMQSPIGVLKRNISGVIGARMMVGCQ